MASSASAACTRTPAIWTTRSDRRTQRACSRALSNRSVAAQDMPKDTNSKAAKTEKSLVLLVMRWRMPCA